MVQLASGRAGWREGDGLAPFYYPAMLALTARFAVLYEDFHGAPNAGSGDLGAFTTSVVEPAFAAVERVLGVPPLVVRLPPAAAMNETDLTFLPAAAPTATHCQVQALAQGAVRARTVPNNFSPATDPARRERLGGDACATRRN